MANANPRIQLLSDEVKVIQLALETMIEEISELAGDPSLPFNPEGRKSMREMLTCARSAKKKLETVTGHEIRLDPYVAGDEHVFFTKES